MRNSPILSTDVNTTSVIDVSSSAGFSAGDLVYLQNGNGTSSPTTSSNVSFQANKALPLAIAAHTGTAVLSAFDSANPSTMKNSAANGICAAVLTNGNTVHVVNNDSPARIYFTILDPSGATVVPFTSAGANTTAASPHASVCALSGGGFVVAGFNTAGNPIYSIFDNSGATVLSQTTYASETWTSGAETTHVFALPNGNWVFVFHSATNAAFRFSIFGPTGATVKAWTTVNSSSSSYVFAMSTAVRSDASFVFAFANSALNTLYLTQYDSTGTTVSTQSVAPPEATRQIYCIGAATMSDGTTIRCAFTYYQANNSPYWKTSYVTLTGTTVSSITNLAGENLTQNTSSGPQQSIGPQSVGIIGLANNSFLIAYQDVTATIGYAVFDSSGTCLTGTNASGAVPILIYGSATGYLSKLTLIELGDYINVYYNNSFYSNNIPRFQCFSKINKTTYELFYPYTVTQNIGSISTTAGAYLKGSSKPTQAVFTTQSTFTTAVNKPAAVVVDGNTALATTSANSVSAALIKDGSVITAECVSNTVTIARYNNQGVYLSTIATVTGSSGQVRVRALENGGFIVLHYKNSGATAEFLVFNSSFIQTTSFTGGEAIATTGTYYWDFDVLKSQNIVWVYEGSSNYLYYKIFSPTGTTVVAQTQINTGTQYNIRVSAGLNDSFFLTSFSGANNYPRFYAYARTGATTWTQYANVQTSAAGQSGVNCWPTALPTGPCAVFYQTSNTTGYLYLYDVSANVLNGSQPGWNNSGGDYSAYLCMTGFGTLAMYLRYSSDQSIGFMGNTGVQGTAYNFPSTNFISSASLSSSAVNNGWAFCAAGLTNWFFYYNSASGNKISLATSLPTSFSITFTQNVAASDPLSIYPTNTTASGIIPNCPLIGVALTSASAGGSGRVVSSGSITLNSSYSNSTPFINFDHQTYNRLGVKGSISGRNVTLTGNA